MRRATIVVRTTGTRVRARTTAAAAPPAPKTSARLSGSGQSARPSRAIWKPAASVLAPMRLPSSVTAIVFTAPASTASPSNSSQTEARGKLYGTHVDDVVAALAPDRAQGRLLHDATGRRRDALADQAERESTGNGISHRAC